MQRAPHDRFVCGRASMLFVAMASTFSDNFTRVSSVIHLIVAQHAEAVGVNVDSGPLSSLARPSLRRQTVTPAIIAAIGPIPRFSGSPVTIALSPLANAPGREALAETPAGQRKGQALG